MVFTSGRVVHDVGFSRDPGIPRRAHLALLHTALSRALCSPTLCWWDQKPGPFIIQETNDMLGLQEGRPCFVGYQHSKGLQLTNRLLLVISHERVTQILGAGHPNQLTTLPVWSMSTAPRPPPGFTLEARVSEQVYSTSPVLASTLRGPALAILSPTMRRAILVVSRSNSFTNLLMARPSASPRRPFKEAAFAEDIVPFQLFAPRCLLSFSRCWPL